MKRYFFIQLIVLNSLWAYAQAPMLSIPTGHERSIRCIDISQDGSLIATGSMDNTVIIWDAKTWWQLRTLSVSSNVQRVLFSSDAKYLIVCANSDGPYGGIAGFNFTLWEVGSGRRLRTFPFEGGPFFGLSPDGRFLAVPAFREGKDSGSGVSGIMGRMFLSQDLVVWDLKKHAKLPGTIPLGNQPVFVPYKNSYLLLTIGFGLQGHKLNFWEMGMLESGEGKRTTYGNFLESFRSLSISYEPTRVAAHPSANFFALVGANGSIEVWDGEKETVFRTLKAARTHIQQITFSADGRLIFAYSVNGKETFVEGWNLQTGETVLSKQLAERATSQIVLFSPSGEYYVCEEDKVAKVYGLRGNELASLRGHAISFDNYVFSTSGRYVQLSKRDGFPKPQAPCRQLKKLMRNSLVPFFKHRKNTNMHNRNMEG